MFGALDDFVRERMGEMYVAMPGHIVSFDTATQTASVQIALNRVDGSKMSQLVDLPVMTYTAGNYAVTLPIKKGDNCLVVFADRCIDDWLESGGQGAQSKQTELRMHSLSDGFVIIGARTKVAPIGTYNADDLEVRNYALDQFAAFRANGNIDITTTVEITLNAPTITANCDDAVVNATASATVETAAATITADTLDITAATSITVETAAATITADALDIAAATTITGTVDITGNVTVTGAFDAVGSSFTHNTVNVGYDHIHYGGTNVDGNTGVPN